MKELSETAHPKASCRSIKVSIVTPSFRQLDWLRLSVKSVRDQFQGISEPSALTNVEANAGSPLPSSSEFTFSIEHVIQDAGSPGIKDFAREVGATFYHDGNLIFATRKEKSDTGDYSLTVYSEQDNGMYDAINRGLAKTSGDICAWLNSDEQYFPGTLKYVCQHFIQNPTIDVLLGDALLTDINHNPVSYRRIMVPSRWHTRLEHLHSLSCAMFFKRSALPHPPLDARWKIISDAVLMDSFLSRGKNILACRQLLASYTFTGINLSSLGASQEHLCWQDEMNIPPLLSRAFLRIVHRIRRFWHSAYAQRVVRVMLYRHAFSHARSLVTGQVGGIWKQPKQ